MKKKFLFAAFALSAIVLGSCGQTQYERSDMLIDAIVDEVSAEQTAQKSSAPKVQETEMQSEDTVYIPEEEPVNIDLTTMNSTMVYSVIYDITVNTDRYFGKTILLDGYFDTAYDETLDTRCCFIVVPDAAACCMQGLEFKLGEDKVYPDDYPEVRTDIRIRGTLSEYDELGQMYCYIDADSLTII